MLAANALLIDLVPALWMLRAALMPVGSDERSDVEAAYRLAAGASVSDQACDRSSVTLLQRAERAEAALPDSLPERRALLGRRYACDGVFGTDSQKFMVPVAMEEADGSVVRTTIFAEAFGDFEAKEGRSVLVRAAKDPAGYCTLISIRSDPQEAGKHLLSTHRATLFAKTGRAALCVGKEGATVAIPVHLFPDHSELREGDTVEYLAMGSSAESPVFSARIVPGEKGPSAVECEGWLGESENQAFLEIIDAGMPERRISVRHGLAEDAGVSVGDKVRAEAIPWRGRLRAVRLEGIFA